MKKIYILGVVIFLLTVCIVLFLVFSTQKQKKIIFHIFPIPTSILPQENSSEKQLHFVSMNPSNNQTGVPLTQLLTFTFNKPVSPDNIYISFFPQINGTTEAQGNSLVITPNSPLEDNTTYTFSVEDTVSQTTLLKGAFSTGTNPVAPLNNGNFQVQPTANEIDRETHPDIFLSNQVPYQTTDFSVTTSFVNGNPVGHYAFLVSTSSTMGKQKFLNWLHIEGLTDQEIQTLDITYQ